MSFAFFPNKPQYKPRGIKVDLSCKKNTKLNLQWDVQPNNNPYIPIVNKINKQKRQQNKYPDSEIRVMDKQNQQQLDKLLKRFKDGRSQKKYTINNSNHNKIDNHNFYTNQNYKSGKLKTCQSQYDDLSISLMQGQLMNNKLDSIRFILDQQSNKMTSMQDSRISRRSTTGNKKNQSFVEFGNGYNPFIQEKRQQKSVDQKLKEIYLYQENLRKRHEKINGIY